MTENNVQYRPEESKLVVTHPGTSRQCALKSAEKIEILELPPDKKSLIIYNIRVEYVRLDTVKNHIGRGDTMKLYDAVLI